MTKDERTTCERCGQVVELGRIRGTDSDKILVNVDVLVFGYPADDRGGNPLLVEMPGTFAVSHGDVCPANISGYPVGDQVADEPDTSARLKEHVTVTLEDAKNMILRMANLQVELDAIIKRAEADEEEKDREV